MGISKDQFSRFIVQVQIEPSGDGASGSVFNKWVKIKDGDKIALYNLMMLEVTLQDFENPSNLSNTLTASIAHEITHLKQSLRNPSLSISRVNKSNSTEKYLLNPAEIDAYAETFAQEMLAVMSPEKALQLLAKTKTTPKGFNSIRVFNAYKRYARKINATPDRIAALHSFMKKAYLKIVAYRNLNN